MVETRSNNQRHHSGFIPNNASLKHMWEMIELAVAVSVDGELVDLANLLAMVSNKIYLKRIEYDV